MFRLANLGVVQWPVQLPQPDGSGERATIFVSYAILTREELRDEQRRYAAAYRGAVAALGAEPDQATLDRLESEGDARDAAALDMLRTRIKGWSGIEDDDGPVAFAADKLDALLAYELYAQPLLTGLFDASRGALAKNSSPGPAGAAAQVQA
jgi:hypothetical protein